VLAVLLVRFVSPALAATLKRNVAAKLFSAGASSNKVLSFGFKFLLKNMNLCIVGL